MFIYVVEGPAGAGKTTLLDWAADDWPEAIRVDERPTTDPPRHYGGLDGLYLATKKDLGTLVKCITYSELGKDMLFLVDRWVLSSLVYDSIRKEGHPIDGLMMKSILSHWLQIANLLQSQLRMRGRVKAIEPIQINWKLLIPDEVTIQRRRRESKRTFIYTPTQEVEAFTEASKLLVDACDFLNSIDKRIEVELSVQNVWEEKWEW